ncbi:MAG: helix-turn-helix domain-containing protein [Lentisphaerae bacterium]|nr:helix-turn-helix domain-containing protein [Lentisphaerota bacterium]
MQSVFSIRSVIMKNFQISQTELLRRCREAVNDLDCPALLYFDAPEHQRIHAVPRLIFQVSGSAVHSYGAEVKEHVIDSPKLLYCSRFGYLRTDYLTPGCSISFSYYPNYIRAMHIDYDGVNQPPTVRDVYYHSSNPLSEAGMELLNCIDILHRYDKDEIAGKLLAPLFLLTLDELQGSESSSVLNVRSLWNEINCFLQEHRTEVISRKMLAKIFRISPGYVSNLSKRYMGMSLSETKLHYQLEHAENLLRNTLLNIDEIAAECGFSSSNYFIRRFKKVYGQTPHVYRYNAPLKKDEME